MGDGIQVENLLNSYVVLDVETTGLHSDDRVIEIGAAKVIDGQIVEEFQQLINPEMVIPPFITSLTGISNDMVADAPTMKTVLPLFISFMDSLPIVGHNVGFDCSMLRWEAQLNSKKVTTHVIWPVGVIPVGLTIHFGCSVPCWVSMAEAPIAHLQMSVQHKKPMKF